MFYHIENLLSNLAIAYFFITQNSINTLILIELIQIIFMSAHFLNDMHSLYYQRLRSFFAQN